MGIRMIIEDVQPASIFWRIHHVECLTPSLESEQKILAHRDRTGRSVPSETLPNQSTALAVRSSLLEMPHALPHGSQLDDVPNRQSNDSHQKQSPVVGSDALREANPPMVLPLRAVRPSKGKTVVTIGDTPIAKLKTQRLHPLHNLPHLQTQGLFVVDGDPIRENISHRPTKKIPRKWLLVVQIMEKILGMICLICRIPHGNSDPPVCQQQDPAIAQLNPDLFDLGGIATRSRHRKPKLLVPVRLLRPDIDGLQASRAHWPLVELVFSLVFLPVRPEVLVVSPHYSQANGGVANVFDGDGHDLSCAGF